MKCSERTGKPFFESRPWLGGLDTEQKNVLNLVLEGLLKCDDRALLTATHFPWCGLHAAPLLVRHQMDGQRHTTRRGLWYRAMQAYADCASGIGIDACVLVSYGKVVVCVYVGNKEFPGVATEVVPTVST